jgi:hypothetical protein
MDFNFDVDDCSDSNCAKFSTPQNQSNAKFIDSDQFIAFSFMVFYSILPRFPPPLVRYIEKAYVLIF